MCYLHVHVYSHFGLKSLMRVHYLIHNFSLSIFGIWSCNDEDAFSSFASPTAKIALFAMGETEARPSALAGYFCLNNDFAMEQKFEGYHSMFVLTWIILLVSNLIKLQVVKKMKMDFTSKATLLFPVITKLRNFKNLQKAGIMVCCLMFFQLWGC